jgi:integrase
MPILALDANVVRNTACPAGKSRLDLYDTIIPGFVLEVRASGSKTYFLRYRDTHGKQRQYRIGDSKSISFEQARQAVQTVRARVTLGEDPAVERATLREVPSLEDFAQNRYLPYIKGYKRAWRTDESFLRNHVLPRFGKKHLDELTRQDVIEFHHGQRAAGYAPATANRFVILLRYMFNLAKKWGIPGSEKNPASGIPLFEENNKRERYVTAEETQRLAEAIRDSDNSQMQHIVPLLLLTGCRKRELLDSQWNHFDLPRRLWRIPISKSGKARHVPLSDGVLQLLAQVPRFPGCPFVVPNPKTRKPYVSVFYSWHTARTRAGMPELRMHDLRHSFASFLINAGRSLYEVQNILGHTQLKTTQRYAHLSQNTLLEAADAAVGAAGLAFAQATA